MKTLKMFKASAMRNETIEDVKITIKDTIKEFDSLDAAEEFYNDQAKKLAEILYTTLPQGTTDRLLIWMMQHQVSLYCGLPIVRYNIKDKDD